MSVFDSFFILGFIAISLIAIGLFYQTRSLARRLRDARDLIGRDPLTGLLDRSSFSEALSYAFHQAETLALIFIDLSNFKDTNDRFGHEAGDNILKAFAARLKEQKPDSAKAARVGGDEFCILLSDTSETEQQAFIDEIRRPFRVENAGIQILCELSAGIAHRTVDSKSPEELMKQADRAMYDAKKRKEGPVTYTPTLDENLRIEREIRTELNDALRNDQLALFYQPIISARSGEMVSAEALMRWPDKIGPAGSPAHFIPIAEESGLIIELGEWALEAVLNQIKIQKTLPITLNVSPRQFLDTDFARKISDAIIRHGVDPTLLKIEITEGVLIGHTDTAQRIIRELREIGVQILLDDFGTGYSSLSYIQKFEFDGLKIDRAFVRQMDQKASGQELLKTIVSLGHTLNMQVIAEGVETRRQAAMLQLLGCDFLQGYALGVPAPAEHLTSFRIPEPVATAIRTG